MNTLLLRVTKAEYVKDYILKLSFNNGETRLFDFSSLFNQGIGYKLKDINYFKNFRLDPFTVDWNDEIGYAPEYLLDNGIKA